jgi:hypothetical protein
VLKRIKTTELKSLNINSPFATKNKIPVITTKIPPDKKPNSNEEFVVEETKEANNQ